MIFDALGNLALGELPQEEASAPTPAPVVSQLRYGGGKLIAAYTLDDNGRLRNRIDELLEKEAKEEEELAVALLMYWNKYHD
jgi:hypothetical protein